MYYVVHDLREDKDSYSKTIKREYLNVSQKSYSRYERGERTIDPEDRFYPNSQHFMKPLLIT